jgi:hypothetical protein
MVLNPALPGLLRQAGAPGNPMARMIDVYMTVYSDYRLMMLVSLEGKVLAVNSVDGAGKKIEDDFLYGKNIAHISWFKDAIEGKFLAGRNGLAGVAERRTNVEMVQQVDNDDDHVIAFAAPIRGDGGKTVSVWVNLVDSAVIEGIVAAARDWLVANGFAHPRISVLSREGESCSTVARGRLALNATIEAARAGEAAAMIGASAGEMLDAAQDLRRRSAALDQASKPSSDDCGRRRRLRKIHNEAVRQ